MGQHEHFGQLDGRIRQALDYDNSTAPTERQPILWVPDGSGGGRFAPRTLTSGDVNAVSLTATETIGGRKSFNLAPIVPVGELLSNPVRRDDARLTDARSPTAHGHDVADVAGAERTANRSVPSARVPNGYIGADASGNVGVGHLYTATESSHGVARGRDMAYLSARCGARNDRLVHGDELSPMPRMYATGTMAGALTTGYVHACQAAYDDIATRVRMCSRAASGGTGTISIGVYVGTDPTTLARAATASVASVNGMLDLALSAQVSWTAGQWIAVMLVMTGSYNPIPSWAGPNVPAALLANTAAGVILASTRASTSALPASLSIAPGQGSSTGLIPWWALT